MPRPYIFIIPRVAAQAGTAHFVLHPNQMISHIAPPTNPAC
jgi:hypothetical protein